MLRLPHGYDIPGAVMAGHRYAGADAQAHEHVHQQVDQRAGGRNRGQRLMAGIVAHHDHVRRVIQKLQDPRQDQRPRKSKDLREQRAFRHVDLMTSALSRSEPKHNLPQNHFVAFLVSTIRVRTGVLKIRPGWCS